MRTDSLTSLEELAALTGQRFQIFAMARPRKPAQPRQHADPLGESLVVLRDAAVAIQDTAKAERRSLTESETQAVESLFAQFERLEDEIDNPGNMPLPADSTAVGTGRRTDHFGPAPRNGGALSHSLAGPDGGAQRVLRGAESRRWENMWPGAGRDLGGFRSSAEFYSTVYTGRTDPRLIRDTAGQSEGVGADGGFFVPSQTLSGVMDAALEAGVIRAGADVAPIQSNSVSIPIWDYMDHSSGIGGFSAVWLAEGATGTPQKGTVRQISMRAAKLAIFSKITSELNEDSPNFVGSFEAALAKAIAWFEDDAYISGAGAATPKGITIDDAFLTVSKESGQSADTVVYQNLVNVLARVHPASFANSVWICNQSVLPQLLQLSVPVTAGNQHVPILNETDGTFRLLSRPLLLTEKAPPLGDAGDIFLCDRSQYLITMRRQATIMTDIGAHWLSDEIGVRITLRVDGRGKWEGPVTPKNGPSLSWAVGIEART